MTGRVSPAKIGARLARFPERAPLETVHHVLGPCFGLLVLGALARGLDPERGRAGDHRPAGQGRGLDGDGERRLHRVACRIQSAGCRRPGPRHPAFRHGVLRHLPFPVRGDGGPASGIDHAASPVAPMAHRTLRRRDPLRPAHRPRPDERPRVRRQARAPAGLDRPAPRYLHRPPLRRADRPRDGLLRSGGVDLVRLGGADRPQPARRAARPGGGGREPDDRVVLRPGDRRPDRPGAGRVRHRDSRRPARGALRPDRHPLRLERRSRRRRSAPSSGSAATARGAASSRRC